MTDKYRICISSPPDRNNLVAEIFFGYIQWAEINTEQKNVQIEFYPRPDGKPWLIDFLDATNALNEAKKMLLEG